MLLIYSHKGAARLLYTCSFIFKELLGIPFLLTIDSEKFKAHNGPKISYSDAAIAAEGFHLQNHPLLFEHDIKTQAIECFTFQNHKAFFKTTEGDFPFDIFAASFYLLTRYEEYLPHEKDSYGRYACENALAYREGFLKLPLVNIWVQYFAGSLELKFPGLALKQPGFTFLPTYDIDIAWSYKHKGLFRNAAGFLRSPSKERIKVLTGRLKDPFDCYDWLRNLHKHYPVHPIYFFLVAENKGIYDKNISPEKDAMWKLVKQHARKYKVGLHPSWQSGDNRSLLKKEKQQLEAMSDRQITVSRQHYIRFNLPEGYERLIAAGITDDYSMGYGSINGFRASVASSFYWYDLEKDENTVLRIHPFCFMDANAYYEQHFSAAQAYEELLHYFKVCKEVNGSLITIWHNNFLGTAKEFEGWKEVYEKFIQVVNGGM